MIKRKFEKIEEHFKETKPEIQKTRIEIIKLHSAVQQNTLVLIDILKEIKKGNNNAENI